MKGCVRVILLLCAGLISVQVEAEQATITFIHSDHLGSPVLGRDMNGNTVWQAEYGPWGELLSVSGEVPDDAGYTGHYREQEIGLVYAGARWYDPELGRFMSSDPVRFFTGNPLSFNRYKYANNNPYLFIDPTGNVEIAASEQGYHVTLVTPNEKVQSLFYKVFKAPAPGWLKRFDRATGAGEAAGKAITMGAPVGPNEPADPDQVMSVDETFSRYLRDNTDTYPSRAYSREEVEDAYNAAKAENKGFEKRFLNTHPPLDAMLGGAQSNYETSAAGQNDRGVERFINPGHGADDI